MRETCRLTSKQRCTILHTGEEALLFPRDCSCPQNLGIDFDFNRRYSRRVSDDDDEPCLCAQVRHAENQVELMKGLLEEKEIENCSVRRQLSQVGLWVLGFWVWGLGFGVSGFGIWGSVLWFRIQGQGISQLTEDHGGTIINLPDIFATKLVARFEEISRCACS
jgi:hypothetical protein